MATRSGTSILQQPSVVGDGLRKASTELDTHEEQYTVPMC